MLTMLFVGPAPGSARVAPALETILQDDAQLLYRPEPVVQETLAELRALGVDRVRVTAGWSVMTRTPDSATRPSFDATDPAAYDATRWAALDRVVSLAPHYGLKVMIDVGFWAPHWAASDPPGPRARADIDPGAFRDFAVAVARRYSGSFVPATSSDALPVLVPNGSDDQFLAELLGQSNPPGGPAGLGTLLSPAAILPLGPRPLPRVDVLTLWNEPNHPGFLLPQWSGGGAHRSPASPAAYRTMVAAAYPAIKRARPDATVLVGATAASASQDTGTDGVPPLAFVRALACVDSRLRTLRSPDCRGFQPVPGDGWAHHPYSLRTLPDAVDPGRPDDAQIGELPRLARLLGQLVARGRLAPGLANLWITEDGYETGPRSVRAPFGPYDQARFLTWSEFLAWQTPGVRSFAQFLLRDIIPATPAGAGAHEQAGEWRSGLERADGTAKPAATTFRIGLLALRAGGTLRLWGRLRGFAAPRLVMLEAAAPGGRFAALTTVDATGGGGPGTIVSVAPGQVIDRRAALPGNPDTRYRLRVLGPSGPLIDQLGLAVPLVGG